MRGRRARQARGGQRRDAPLLRAPRAAAPARPGAERPPALRRGHGAVPPGDQGGAGRRLHPDRDRGVPPRSAARRPRPPRRCASGWRRRSTRSTLASRACGGCGTSSRASSAARATRSTTAPAAPPTSPAAGASAAGAPVAAARHERRKRRATRCARPRSAAPCCPGRTCCTRGRCRPAPRRELLRRARRVPVRLRLGEQAVDPRLARASRPAAGPGARRTGARSSCGSSTTSTTSSS